MERNLQMRLGLVAAILVVVGVSLAPTLMYDYSEAAMDLPMAEDGSDPRSSLPSWWSEGLLSRLLPQNGLSLGLDLQGGMDLVVSVNVGQAVDHELQTRENGIRDAFKENKIDYNKIEVDKAADTLTLEYAEDKSMRDGQEWLRGGDLVTVEGKDSLVQTLALSDAYVRDLRDRTVLQTRNVLNRRMDGFGLREPEISRQGENRIRLQLPGAKDPERIKKAIKTKANLEFFLVDDGKDGQPMIGEERELAEQKNQGKAPPGMALVSWENIYSEKGETIECYFIETTGIGPGPVSINRRLTLNAEEPGSGSIDEGKCYLLREDKSISGSGLVDARPQMDPDPLQSNYVVNFTWNAASARKFAKLTGENVSKLLAVVLDGRVESAPQIKSRIYKRGQITGNFGAEEAAMLSTVLKSGALQVGITFEEERTVGATLGADSIKSGKIAIFWGALTVVVFMVIYYRVAGIIADVALVMNIAVIMAALGLFGATLTLPGIAGIVLTVGMAVDANVLIFERVREELRTGKTPMAAIEAGYGKALWTILDANITTLIAALVLLQWGTGPIKGFAITLAIGIVTSMFTAIVVTRIIYDLLFHYRKGVAISIGIKYEPAVYAGGRRRR